MGIARKFINFVGGYIFGGFISGLGIPIVVSLVSQSLPNGFIPSKYYNIITTSLFFGILIPLVFIVTVKCWKRNRSFLLGFLLGTVIYTIGYCKGIG